MKVIRCKKSSGLSHEGCEVWVAWVERRGAKGYGPCVTEVETTGGSRQKALEALVEELQALQTQAACEQIEARPVPQQAKQATLPTFGAGGECVKCGWWTIDATYHRSSDLEAAYDEHMHRECQRCHYKWLEACKDAKEGA